MENAISIVLAQVLEERAHLRIQLDELKRAHLQLLSRLQLLLMQETNNLKSLEN